MITPDAGLARWIEELRGRLERGDLADVGPLELGYGTGHLPGEAVVRILLLDRDDLDNPAGSWGGDAAWRDEADNALLDERRRLRELIG